jgi:signal transduction histidine kinase
VEQILFNLIDNACKYASTAEDRRIHLQFETGIRNISIRVKDHGPGVTEQEMARLFQPFSKSAHDAANSAPGVGLGLALCRRLAADLGGRLKANQNAGGAEFVLALPR